MSDKEKNNKITKDCLASLAKAKFQLDKIQRLRPYLIEYRIINEMILQVRDNLLEMLGPREEESE